MKFSRTFFIVSVVLLATHARAQTTLINDGFNDTSIGTNSGGTGHGFVNAASSQVATPESGGVADFTSGGVQQIASSPTDAFNPFQAGAATTLTVTFGAFGFSPGFDRQWVGFVKTGGTNFYFPSPAFAPGDQGLYLSAAYDNPNEDGNFGNATPHRGNLVAISNTGAISTLASWDWVAQPGAGFSVTLTTTATTFEMAFSGATVSSYATGAASGALTGLGALSGNFDAFVYGQSAGGASSFTVDSLSVVVSPVPEPATWAGLAGTLVLGLAVFRRRVTGRGAILRQA